MSVRTTPLCRAAWIEDLKAVVRLLVERQVRVTEDHGAGPGEVTAQPLEPAAAGPRVVNQADPVAAEGELGPLRQPLAQRRLVDVAMDGDDRRSKPLELLENTEPDEVACMNDEIGCSQQLNAGCG